MPDLVNLIKRAAADAVAAQKPADIRYGTVAGTEPLEIILEQRMKLGAAQLLVPECMTDHEVAFEAELMTETAGADAHAHALGGRIRLRWLNGLKEGEHVLLLRIPGGQKYIVLDRVMK